MTFPKWHASCLTCPLAIVALYPLRCFYPYSALDLTGSERRGRDSAPFVRQVRARQEPGGWQRWIVWADAAEMERLRAYRDRDIAADHRRRWTATSTGTNRSKGSTP